MTDVASALPSAGWYDDPSSDASMRWWDGRGWTDNSMPKPASLPEPSAPPMGIAYSVDEQRATDSPRRAARARALRSEDGLAPIVQLHPVHAEVDADPQPALFSHSAEPLPVVPPVTAPQDAAPVAEPSVDLAHLPQLGRVPDQVFAPEPVAVVVAPVASAAAPVASVAPAAAPAPVAPAPLAPVTAAPAAWNPAADLEAPVSIPAPGSLVGAPEVGSTIDFVLPGSAASVLPAPRPIQMVATPITQGHAAAPALPVGLPTSPEAFIDEPEPQAAAEPVVASAPLQNSDWWAGLVPSRSSTAPARLLALAPFVSIAAMAAAAFVIVKLPELLLVTLAIPMLALIIPIVLAAVDRRALHELGWERQAGALWVLLGPFWYLVARQVVLARQGARVAPLMIGTILISVAAPVALTVGLQYFQPQLINLVAHVQALGL